MRRVVITGLGIVSCLGNDKATVSARACANGRPVFVSRRVRRNGLAQPGFRPSIDLNLEELIDRKLRRFMGDAAPIAYIAMEQAIADAGLSAEAGLQPAHRPDRRLGRRIHRQPDGSHGHLREKGVKRVGPIGAAHHGQHRFRLPGYAVQNQGRELLDQPPPAPPVPTASATPWSRSSWASRTSCLPAAVRKNTGAKAACSTPWAPCPPSTTTPRRRPRVPTTPSVMASSSPAAAAWWCSKSWSTHSSAGAKIYAEIVGYGATSDGYDMVAPPVKAQCVACNRRWPPSIHPSTTSTPTAPRRRWATSPSWRGSRSVRRQGTGDQLHQVLTGHSLGAAGVQEAIYCLLMMEDS
jgi:3-oxoacyl-[acyl-carrier-protein] synthase I